MFKFPHSADVLPRYVVTLELTSTADPPQCSTFTLHTEWADGVSTNCLSFLIEVNTVSSITSCADIACELNSNVYEFNGSICRFYNCTASELANLPTTTFWGGYEIHAVSSKTRTLSHMRTQS